MRTLLHVDCRNDQCPRYPGGEFLPTEVVREHDGQLDVLFVGGDPTDDDVRRDRPFAGDVGALLHRYVTATIGRGRANYGLTLTHRCSGAPDPRVTDICRGFVEREIERLDPRVVVLVGSLATSLRRTEPVTRVRRQWWREGGRIWMAMWSPRFVARGKNTVPLFAADIALAFRLARDPPDPALGARGEPILCRTVSDVERLVRDIRSLGPDGFVALDVETRNLNKVHGNALALLQFSWDGRTAYCVPYRHRDTPFDATELEEVRQLLADLFTRPLRIGGWIVHFGKFEQTIIGHHILGGRRVVCNAPWFDTGALAYLGDENGVNDPQGAYGLKRLVRLHLGFQHYDDETLAARSEGSLYDLPMTCDAQIGDPRWRPNLLDYGAMDAYVTWRLFMVLRDDLRAAGYWEKAERLALRFYAPVYRLLSVIERNGFWANVQHLEMLRDPRRSPVIRRLLEIDREIVPKIESAQRVNERLADEMSGGCELLDVPWLLDLQKNAHVVAWLVDELGLEPLGRGKSGAPSVDKAFFDQYDDVEEVALVKERRALAKLANAYVKQILGYLDPTRGNEASVDGRIRCDIHLTTSATGRSSASNPNMQQQLRSDNEAKAAIKSIFQAEQPGAPRPTVDLRRPPKRVTGGRRRCIVQLDYMAAEARIWGIMARCPDLASIFNRGKAARDQYRAEPTDENRIAADIGGDLHKQVASNMFGVPILDVSKDLRTSAKCIAEGAWLQTRRGMRRIEEIEEGDEVWTGTSVRRVTATMDNGDRECVELRTERGYELTATPDHRVWVLDPSMEVVWKEIKDLTTDDVLVIPQGAEIWPTKAPALTFDYDALVPTDHCHTNLIRTATPPVLTIELARLLGHLVAEGSVTDGYASFCNSDPKLLDDYQACAVACFDHQPTRQVNHITRVVSLCYAKYVATFLREACGVGAHCRYQRIPWVIRAAPRQYVIEFLRAYFAGDGTSKPSSVSTTSAAKPLIHELQVILLNLGIVASVNPEIRRTPKGREYRVYWKLLISGQDMEKFHEEVGFVGPKRVVMAEKRGRYAHRIPHLKAHTRRLRTGPWSPAKSITYAAMRQHKILEKIRSRDSDLHQRLTFIDQHNFYFDAVREIRSVGRRRVYDLTIEKEHRFVANGLSAHNCLTFGLLFGRGAASIGRQIGKTRDEAEVLMKKFAAAFPRGWRYLQNQPRLARRNGFVESPLGRRRRLPGYMMHAKRMTRDDENLIASSDRMAMNSPIQSFSSDIAFLGAAMFAEWIDQHDRDWLVENVVHDSCVYEVPIDELQDAVTVAERLFTTDVMDYVTQHWGMEWNCPIEVEFEIGLDWGRLMKWDFSEPGFEKILKSLR